MAINLTGGLPPEILGQQQELNRQQQMAQMLMQQGQQMPQGQMVSGRYVPSSFFQNIAPLAQLYAGQKIAERGDKQALDLARQLRQVYGDEIKEFRTRMQGVEGAPEKITEMAGPYGQGVGEGGANVPMPTAYMPARAAVAPDPQGAYNFAASASNPALQAIGIKNLTPEAITLSEGQKRFMTMPDGTLKEVGSGGEKVDPETRRAMQFLRLNKPIDQLTDQELQAVERKAVEFKKAGATSITIPTEGERRAGFMSNILDRNILQMQTALGVDPTAVKPNVPASIASALTGPNLLSRSMTPAQRQIVEDSQLDVLDAALTLRTGAAYTPVQLNAMRDTYFPVLGDKPAAIKAKQQRLETLLEGAYIASGRAMPERVSTPPPPAPLSKVKSTPAPSGVDQRVWDVMTSQEKALFK
jgi:hypothetical protein